MISFWKQTALGVVPLEVKIDREGKTGGSSRGMRMTCCGEAEDAGREVDDDADVGDVCEDKRLGR